MEIILGKTAGFCFGVTNAVQKTEKILQDKTETIYCLGELTHNSQVTGKLTKNGLHIIEDIDNLPNNSAVIIRSHGVPKKIYEKAKEKNIKLIDLTCPKVAKIHKTVEKYIELGYYILLIADKLHPETVGTIGFCDENSDIVSDVSDIDVAIKKLHATKIQNVVILAQTTFSLSKFNEIVEEIKRKLADYNVEIQNTICDATKNRQQETEEISKKVDLMIIIGGKNSSNTKKLYEISKNNCKAILIETANELEIEEIKKYNKIGVMAGASTPEDSINDVIELLNR